MNTVATFMGKAGRGHRASFAAATEESIPLPNCLVGIEVEMDQDTNTPLVKPQMFEPEWVEKYDGSLVNGSEYVLAAPLKGHDWVLAAHKLFDEPTKVQRTYTGSTHIHLDMMDDISADALRTLALLCYTMENMLYAAGDSTRRWCGYANQFTSAPAEVLASILKGSFDDVCIQTDRAGRYYGLNLQALNKYGSVEFRYFPTATSAKELIRWVKLCQLFKKAAMEIGTVENLIDQLNTQEGMQNILDTYFADYTEEAASIGGHRKVKALMHKAMILINVNKDKMKYDLAKLQEAFVFKAVKPKTTTGNIVIVGTGIGDHAGVPSAGLLLEQVGSEAILFLVHTDGAVYVSSPLTRHGTRYADWQSWEFISMNIAEELAPHVSAVEIFAVENGRHTYSTRTWIERINSFIDGGDDEEDLDLDDEEDY